MPKLSFSKAALAEIKELCTHYPDRRSAVMGVLYIAQKEFGWMKKEVMDLVAETLKIPVFQVWEVVSFYTLYHRQPVGKFHLQVCNNISCTLRGSQSLVDAIRNKYQISNGETSKNGLFTITEVECLGSCGTAPVIQINEDYYENMDVKKLEEFFKKAELEVAVKVGARK
jgi:NADH-quinone oxidoreductase E subunit